jgi:hypothetical protein
MRLRLGIDPAAYSDRLASVGIRPGAYNGWIDGFRGAIERVFNVKPDEAAAMLEAAADRYKMRAIASVSDPDAAIRALADDISRTKRAGKDAAVRAQLEHELKIAARARP